MTRRDFTRAYKVGAICSSVEMSWRPAPGSAQARALACVEARSSGSPVEATLRVTLNFHPDRLHGEDSVLEALARDGFYRSQFETASSNGALTAHEGGSRWHWESRIFCGSYDGLPGVERPKYGALNFRHRAVGGSPRFGSAHLRLKPEVLQRCTFCYPDSFFEPSQFGVATRMALIPSATTDARDRLDDYIEAHVHGPLRMGQDVEALVLDPSYLGTATEATVHTLPCPVEWHSGFRLDVATLHRHAEYRGPEYVRLAVSLARDGLLTPAILGEAWRTGRYDAQSLKKVWHYLARFGDRTA